MKKEYFKKNTVDRKIIPELLLKINNLLSKLMENGRIRLYGPFLLGVGLLTVFLMDEPLGIFLGITNSMNLLAEAGKNSSENTPACLQGLSNMCPSFKACQTACENTSESFSKT
ncbi:MAG: hypothetical protein ABEK36_06490 [Candidatus Aenigmatarchaeota archaeon]